MQCLLVCEGSSDTPLVSHIQRMLDGHGYHAADFHISTDGRRLVEKVSNGLEMRSRYDLVFVHRDADRAGADARYREITEAVRMAGYSGLWVGIVPVRMTESWLLLDEAAIRNVVGKPFGRLPLNLPLPRNVERITNPKSELENALQTARQARGRRRRNFDRQFFLARRQLLESLPVGGALEQLPSWVRFRDDTIRALQELNG